MPRAFRHGREDQLMENFVLVDVLWPRWQSESRTHSRRTSRQTSGMGAALDAGAATMLARL
jgi:hypothetical protein